MVATMEGLFKSSGIWLDKPLYDDAEKRYYEKLAHNPPKKVSLAGEVAKARERIKQSLENVDDLKLSSSSVTDGQSRMDSIDDQVGILKREVEQLKVLYGSLQKVVIEIQGKLSSAPIQEESLKKEIPKPVPAADDDDGDDVDLFGSDSDDGNEEAKKIKEQRLAAYAAKKSKKPSVIAKSNIILDVKPWDDETDMKELEKAVRKVTMDGLIWGASKLVPLAYGINKLQISCVVEDDKVSVDELQETLQEIDDYVQSVDIAAFNKV